METKRLDNHIKALQKRRAEILQLLERVGHSVQKPPERVKREEKYFPLAVSELKQLKVACIMDRFTLDSYSPECRLFELTPENWQGEMESFCPDMLFIESAWEGKDKRWYRKIDRCSKELFELCSYCQEKEIPIVFWNKEDPVYTGSFMATARMADVVFTTDIDCVEHYKSELGHDRVYHLHFAAQPQIHNPVEKYERLDKFCFAGAYYHRYKERAETFDRFSEVFIATKGFDIYDRNYQNARPEHAFPERYNPYILGRLDPGEIDRAYKGYTYGVNMNSIQQSQTMFARRAFELMASNTIVAGNYSRGIKNYFGDLTICTNDAQTLKKEVEAYCADGISMRKYRLLGLRKILQGHLYEDRLDFIVQKVFGRSLKKALPAVAVVAYCRSGEEAERVKAAFDRQDYPDKRLYLLGESSWDIPEACCWTEQQAKGHACASLPEGYAACFVPEDYYGPHYLSDLMRTLRYGTYTAIGKGDYASYEDGAVRWQLDNKEYRPAGSLYSARAVFAVPFLGEETVSDFSHPKKREGSGFFSADIFNYCAGFDGCACPEVDDLVLYDQGIPLCEIEKAAERIAGRGQDTGIEVLPEKLADKVHASAAVSCSLQNGMLQIESSLPEGKHEYLYAGELLDVEEWIQEGKLSFLWNCSGSLDLIAVCVFYDQDQKKLEPAYPRQNTLVSVAVPAGARFVKLGFRPKGPGTARVQSIRIGASRSDAGIAGFLSRSNVLVLSNQYPAPEALYRNMFVHKRMTCYKQEGHVYDVMRINPYVKPGYREFEGINVVDGMADSLAAILETGKIDTVCVHFLDGYIWSVLRNFADKIRILVWTHGADIEPWWRREYNYSSADELEKAKAASAVRQAFWTDLFSHLDQYPSLHFIFVSQHFAEVIFEDYNIRLPADRYDVIHNCIDTQMFTYEPKQAGQRKRLLSVRTYASRRYANDLTVKCIQALSHKPYFPELEICLIGNGELFESTLRPLKKYKNVRTEKRFLRQDEMAALYKQYGIFLVPTRGDTQGVSRDEAMSSGMVPVTNAVDAVPEFVDDSCSILAPGEDFQAMADGIDRLICSPDDFLRLSDAAAERVRRQTAKEFTIDREIGLISSQHARDEIWTSSVH